MRGLGSDAAAAAGVVSVVVGVGRGKVYFVVILWVGKVSGWVGLLSWIGLEG